MDEDNEWFESLFLANPIPAYIFNSDSLKIERVNQAAIAQYGYSEAEFLSKTLYDLRPRDEHDDLGRTIPQLQNDHAFVGEFRHRTRNESMIWVQVIAHPISYNGARARLVQALNITDKKTAEAATALAQRRYQALIEHSQDIITVSNIEGRFIYVSPAFLKATGYEWDEVINTMGRDFLHPDERELVPEIRNALFQHPGETIPMVNRIRRKDGSFIPVEGTLINLLDESSVQGVVSNYREITQQLLDAETIKHSEANLRAVFDSAVEGFVITDNNLIIQSFNKVAKNHIFSNTKRRELTIGASLLDYVSPDRTDFFKGIIPRVMAGENLEYKTYDQNFGSRWINYCLYPVQNDSNEIIGICIAGKDVTERIEFEDQLKLSEQRYKALVKEGSDLINIIDLDGNYKFISPAVKSNLDPRALGENAFQYVHEEDRQKLKDELNLLRDVKRVRSSPYRFKISDDKYLWMETVGTNLMDDPAIEGIVINSHEVTDTVNHIKAIEERNTRLEEIAWIHAHLVRAPLASILGIIEILKTSRTDFDELMPYLEQSAVQLDKVIGEITQKANDLTT
jgi:PAS domain S-box-containing protein